MEKMHSLFQVLKIEYLLFILYSSTQCILITTFTPASSRNLLPPCPFLVFSFHFLWPMESTWCWLLECWLLLAQLPCVHKGSGCALSGDSAAVLLPASWAPFFLPTSGMFSQPGGDSWLDVSVRTEHSAVTYSTYFDQAWVSHWLPAKSPASLAKLRATLIHVNKQTFGRQFDST